MNQVAGASTPDPAYRSLYRLGGVDAILVAFLTLIEVIVFTLYPQPSTVGDWFELFQANPIIGLLDFWGLAGPMYIMNAVVFLALNVPTLQGGVRYLLGTASILHDSKGNAAGAF